MYQRPPQDPPGTTTLTLVAAHGTLVAAPGTQVAAHGTVVGAHGTLGAGHGTQLAAAIPTHGPHRTLV